MRLPIAFSPIPVTIIVVLVYAALFVSLLYTHLVVPPSPSRVSTYPAVDGDVAWRDLQELSNGFHHFNTHRNDEIHNWLLHRIESILRKNKVEFDANRAETLIAHSPAPVVVFNDRTSNVSVSRDTSSTYFESTNIIVYIRGTDDENEDWWKAHKPYKGQGGVLVNAHYDSVSTGFGATDDGAGVVTVLQLIAHFTSEGNRPKRGIVALLNNGEEDFLNGAYAFAKHPLSQFPRSFLNLEGAGSGGRATLFRSTDAEVTKAYQKSPYPFGTVISADGFKRRLVRSGTDYQIFTSILDMRGLDVAFMGPRSNYHTVRDDTKHSSLNSLWHMLSSSLATMGALTSEDSFAFDKTEQGTETAGSEGVWFDLYGRTFAVFKLDALFGISVALLVAGPLSLIALHVTLSRIGKWYPFSRTQPLSYEDADDTLPGLPLDGFRGFFRPIVTMIISTAVVVALAFLLARVNPYVIYSHEYTVWTMMLTAFTAISWFCLRAADSTRPTALQRFYTLFWMYIISYILLVGVTILERNFDIAGTYFIVIYSAAMFLALLIAYCEFFFLPSKNSYAQFIAENEDAFGRADSTTSSRAIPPRSQHHSRSRERLNTSNDTENAIETTSLLRDDHGTTSFAGYGGARGSRRASGQASSTLVPTAAQNDDDPYNSALGTFYPNEQPWSARLPSYLWMLQFLILCPIPVILTGQISLLLTYALHQTPADGNPVLQIYLFLAGLTFFLLTPLLPFLHRLHPHLPTLLLLISILSVLFNLLSFPFSESSRLKTYFVQYLDLDTGINHVGLTGVPKYIHDIASSVPSAADQDLDCHGLDLTHYSGLRTCRWPGLPPRSVPNSLLGLPESAPPALGYKDWLSVNVSRDPGHNTARFEVRGRNTRACRILFDRPISNFSVEGGEQDDNRFIPVGEKGSSQLRLWSRNWERGWNVSVEWKDSDQEEEARGMDGKVVCLWSDANQADAIPALEELWRFMPVWSTAVKGDDGLVEGSKRFAV
ncbi:MAG: hypothetical protein Q9157_005762 [Trypethelium eluteriae]